MTASISSNTQAILLLTAPLIVGQPQGAAGLLSLAEYNRLARCLRELKREPGDLLSDGAAELLRGVEHIVDGERAARLLGRGFLLAQAIERWHASGMWVLSRADAAYPRRLRVRLKEDAPPVLYGCGHPRLLDVGGLAIVGSRDADEALLEYTQSVARRTAAAHRAVISGGARGIDQAAMRGALEAGGWAAGILADSLQRAALTRDNRASLMDGRLVLASPYDPSASFNVGHAMQRNKLVYALADAALVVSSDLEKGGTWAGAIEQLERLRLVRVYVRSQGQPQRGLDALLHRGATAWPAPGRPEELLALLSTPVVHEPPAALQSDLWAGERPATPGDPGITQPDPSPPQPPTAEPPSEQPRSPAEQLFATVRELLQQMAGPQTDADVAQSLGVSKAQAKVWIERLLHEGVLEKLEKPTRYRSARIATGSTDLDLRSVALADTTATL